MNVTVVSYFDQKSFRAYFFHLLLKRFAAKVLRVLLFAEVLLLIVYLSYYAISYQQLDYEMLGLGLLVILINGSYFLVMVLMARRMFKKHQTVYETKTQYQFQNKHLSISLPNHPTEKGIKVEYSQFHRIEETKHYIYLILTNGRAHVLRKDQMTKDQLLALQQHFQVVFAKRYQFKRFI